MTFAKPMAQKLGKKEQYKYLASVSVCEVLSGIIQRPVNDSGFIGIIWRYFPSFEQQLMLVVT